MTNIQKVRADILLHEKGLAESRAKAQAYIMAGLVTADGRKVNKAGDLIHQDADIKVKQTGDEWVSRGGHKLDHGLKHFGISAAGKVCLDIGASTGGFTDVLLKNGAKKVYAVDVGYGQIHERLRDNPKVVVLEKTNARYLTREQISESPQLIVCDASFISLRTILPASFELGAEKFELIALIKPQFEVGRDNVGAGGVVRDKSLHDEVCTDIKNWMEEQGLHVLGIAESPILGPKGNREFLIAAKND